MKKNLNHVHFSTLAKAIGEMTNRLLIFSDIAVAKDCIFQFAEVFLWITWHLHKLFSIVGSGSNWNENWNWTNSINIEDSPVKSFGPVFSSYGSVKGISTAFAIAKWSSLSSSWIIHRRGIYLDRLDSKFHIESFTLYVTVCMHASSNREK